RLDYVRLAVGIVDRSRKGARPAVDTEATRKPELHTLRPRVRKIIPFHQRSSVGDVIRPNPTLDTETLPDEAHVQIRGTRHLHARSQAIPAIRLHHLAQRERNIPGQHTIVAAENIAGILVKWPPANRPFEIRRIAHFKTQVIR